MVGQRLCRICQRQCQSGCSVKYSDADGPPKDRGRSAHVGQILPEAVLFGLQCKKFSKADGPPGYRGQSATGQKGGVGQT